jgi:uncharacterized lipoprotein NlpE involved in copper resistance
MMKKYLFALVLIAFFWLTGCQNRNVEAQSAPEATATTVAASATQSPGEVDHCAACHTDKEQLISTAKPEEAVEKESSGAG